MTTSAFVLIVPENADARPSPIRAASGWAIETVDSDGSVGYYSSMEMDELGNAHIAYYSGETGAVMYATNSAGYWEISTVDDSINADGAIELAVDDDGAVHICYFADGPDDLRYATNAGGSWVTAIIDDSVGQHNHIFVDHNGTVHISYYSTLDLDLKYATNAGGSWTTETAASVGNVGQHCSLVVDNYDTVYISYYDASTATLKMATKISGEWINYPVDGNPTVGLYTSLALEAPDKLHLSYYNQTGAELKYRYFDGVAWAPIEVVDTVGQTGFYSSIAVGTDMVPRIAYYDVSNSNLRVADRQNGAWNTVTVDSEGDVGSYASLGLGPNNRVSVAYCDATNSDLKFASEDVWAIQKLGGFNYKTLGDTSIALDSDNNAYISYYGWSGFKLMLATNSGGSWDYQVVDSTYKVGDPNDIAVDSLRKVHIAYYDALGGFVKYATNSGGSWLNETVGSVVKNFSRVAPSIAVDSANKAHIAYYDTATFDLVYATNAGGSWVLYTVDSAGFTGMKPSIAVDGNDKVHISFHNNFDISGTWYNELKYATNSAGSWNIVTVDKGGKVGDYSSIAIDGNGKVHISYHDTLERDLKYANNVVGSWQNITLDRHGETGYHTSIGVDQSNKVHIGYYDSTNRDLKYVSNAGGAWAITTVDSSGDMGEYCDLAMGTDGKAHIAYKDGDAGYVGYATNSPWRMKTIQALGSVGSSTSLAIDHNGALHMSYYDLTNTDLRYATNAGGAWSSIPLDDTNQVGSSNCLALDTNGKVHISYYDSLNGNLKYATNAGGTWIFDTIDSIGSVGSFTSIAVDSNGKVHISYYDDTNDDLKYATNAGGSWANQTVDAAGNVGLYTSIGLDGNGKAHISYYDLTNTGLKYANNTGGSWSITSIDWIDNVGKFSSLVVDVNDKVHICYQKETGGDLKYATNAAGNWVNITKIDGTANIVGSQYTSMAIDLVGTLHVSYYDETNADIRYANNVGGAWSHDSVDRQGTVGRSSSIAVDWNGIPHILYLDITNNRIKVASLNAEPSEPTNMQAVRAGLNAEISWGGPLLNNGYPVDGYVVRRTTEDGRTELTYLTHFDTSYTDEGLADGVYSYSVAAHNTIGYGPFCAAQEVNISTEVAVAPSAPTGLTAVGNETLIYLAWSVPNNDGGSPITSYKIYRGTTYGSETHLSTVGTQTYYHDDEVSGGVNYYYKVSAVNNVGEGPLSEGAVGSLVPPSVPGAPGGLVADSGSGYVQLTWSAPSNDGGSAVTGYKIYRNITDGIETELLATLGDQLGYNDSTAINGVTYQYQVSAVNAIGEGALSTGASATPVGAPSAPQNLTATLDGNNVSLAWEQPLQDGGSDLTGYKLYRGTTSGALSLLDTLGLVLSYHDTTTLANTSYYYHVIALNAIGESPASNEAATDPDLPSAVSLTANTDGSVVTLTWTAPVVQGSSAVSAYKVYRGTSAGAETLLTALGNVLTYVDEDVDAGNTYYYKVTALNAQGEGPFSNEVSAEVGSVPSAPQGLEAVAGNGTVTLTWTAPADNGGWNVTGYKVYRGITESTITLLTTLDDVLTYVDTDLVNGQRYYYRVSAINDQGEGDRAESVHATPLAEDDGTDEPDEEEGGDSTMLFILIGLVAVAGVAGAVFFLKKKK